MPLLSCSCGKTLRVPDAAGGKPVRCPACSAVMVAPPPEDDPGPPIRLAEDPPPAGYDLPPDDDPPPAKPRHPLRWKSRYGAGRKRAQKQVYLGCGTLAVLFGVALVIGAQITQEEGTVKVTLVAGAIAVFGLVSVIQALTDTMPDDWKQVRSF